MVANGWRRASEYRVTARWLEKCGMYKGRVGLERERGSWIPEISGRESQWYLVVDWRESRMTARPDLAKSSSKYHSGLSRQSVCGGELGL